MKLIKDFFNFFGVRIFLRPICSITLFDGRRESVGEM
jgi:hypothetical protein